MIYTEKGNLVINAYMAQDALPVEGVLVRVYGVEEGNNGEEHSAITDEDGVTPPISLLAPSIDYSLSPSPREQPYSVYSAVLTKPGYYTKIVNGIAVFADTTTVLPVNMIIDGNTDSPPRGSLEITSQENPRLE